MGATDTLSILFLLCCHGFSTAQGNNNCTGLEVRDPDRNWEVMDVNCTCYTKSSCEDETNFPPHLLGGPFVGKPAFFDALSDRNLINGSYRIRMNLTWRPALSGNDLSYLRGFVVYMDPISPLNPRLCRIFDFTENVFTNVRTTFNFFLEPMRKETLYFVQLYSLPLPRNEADRRDVRQVSFVYTQSLTSTNYETNPKDWVTSISYQLLEEKDGINATFYFAPENLNFTRYTVRLLSGSDTLTVLQSKEVDHTDSNVKIGRFSFENVPTGSYSVSVQPVDTYFNYSKRCLCYSMNDPGDYRQCTLCTVSRTPVFNFTSRLPPLTSSLPTTPPTKSVEVSTALTSPPGASASDVPVTAASNAPVTAASDVPVAAASDVPVAAASDVPVRGVPQDKDDDGWKTVLPAVTGVLAAIALLASIGFFVWRRHLKCRRDSASFRINPPSSPAANTSTLVPHVNNALCTVFLVFAEDHEAHVEAVRSLARYLQESCHCEVMFAPRCTYNIQKSGMLPWVMEMLEKSDFILVVNSEAAFHLGQAWRGSRRMEQLCPSPTKDFFPTAFSRLCARLVGTQSMHNILATHFDYTAPEFVLSEINQGIRYVLPSHLTDVVNVIQQAREPWRSNGAIPPAPHYLRESVRKAAAFERSNLGWFDRNFRVDMLPPFVQRLDSGIESLPRDRDDNNLGLDSPAIRLNMEDSWPTYNNIIDDECRTYYPPTELDAPSIYTYGTRNLGGPGEPEDGSGELPVGHLHVDMEGDETGVYHLPSTGPMNIPTAPYQGSGDSLTSPAAESQQGPGRAFANIQGMGPPSEIIPPVGFSGNDIPEEFHPPMDPDMFSCTSISPSEGLRRINMNSDRDWEMAGEDMGMSFRQEWDACSGKSV